MTLSRRWTKANGLCRAIRRDASAPRGTILAQSGSRSSPAAHISEPILQQILCSVHEFKGSLSTVELAIAGVSDGALGALDRRRLEISREQLHHMYEALDGIIAAIRDGIPVGIRQTLDLHPLLEECISGIQAVADNCRIDVSRFYHNRPLVISADREQLRMCFNSILRNAMEAIGSGGALSVSTAVTGDCHARWAAVVFTDTGAGLSHDAVRQAFVPFFSTKCGGSGLGLYLARRVLSEHGGSIELASEPGPGTSVFIRLPLHRGQRRWIRS